MTKQLPQLTVRIDIKTQVDLQKLATFYWMTKSSFTALVMKQLINKYKASKKMNVFNIFGDINDKIDLHNLF